MIRKPFADYFCAHFRKFKFIFNKQAFEFHEYLPTFDVGERMTN